MRITIATKPLLALLVFVFSNTELVTGQQKTANLNQLRTSLQSALDTVVANDALPGATLAVCLPEEQSLALASRFADIEAKIAMCLAKKAPFTAISTDAFCLTFF